MSGIEFTKKLKIWLDEFLKKDTFSKYELLDIIIPESSLSKINNGYIKSLQDYSSWDFKPDLLGILMDKETKHTRLVLVNRSTSSISLKEIGEIHCYAKLVDAEYAFIISTNGLSNEVSILLLETDIHDRLLKYSGNKTIIIGSWNEFTSTTEKS